MRSKQYDINKQVEELIKAKGGTLQNYTANDLDLITKFSGYGGIADDRISIKEAKGSFTEFYTPDTIVKKMWELAYKHGFTDGHSVIEPSVGIGAFLKYLPEKSPCTAYEINPISATICQLLFPKVKVFNQAFEKIFIDKNNTIKDKTKSLAVNDLVIGNPPYGEVGGQYMGMGEKKLVGTSDWVTYFIYRGLDLLKSGGLLVYIIGTEVAAGGKPWLSKSVDAIKTKIAQKAELVDAYRLPNGVFERTDVVTDIIVMKKI